MKPVEKIGEEKQWKWLGHLDRIGGGAELQGKSTMIEYRKKWERRNIFICEIEEADTRAVEKVGISWTDPRILAQDGKLWKKLMKTK